MIVRTSFWHDAAQYLLHLLLAVPFGAVFYYIVNRFLRVRRTWWARASVLVAGTVAAFNVVYVADAFNILFFLPFFAAALWKGTEGSGNARFSMILILYPMTMAFNAVLDNVPLWFDTVSEWYYIFEYLLRAGFWGALALLARRAGDENGAPLLSRKLWLLLDLLALTPAAAVFVLVVFPSYGRMSDQTVQMFQTEALFVLPAAAVSSAGLLYAVTVLSRHEALRRQEELWNLRSLYYQNLEQEQLQVRRLRHDMANHLQALSGLLDTPEKARAYLDSLTDRPGLTASRRFCGNPVVNTVLAGKLARMEEAGIEAGIAVELPERLPLSDPDLCALFANALDNAIEACEKMEGRGKIEVQAKTARGLFLVRVSNGTGESAPATLETTKPDKANHGYGIPIIREIVGRAGGSCEIVQRAGVFEVVVTVPLTGGEVS